jgi:uncharacterized membrane protein
MTLLIAGLVLFLGLHSIAIIAPSARVRLVATLGEGPWKGLFTLGSLAGLALIVIGFGAARASTAVLYSPPVWLRHAAVVLLLPALPLGFASVLPGRIRQIIKNPLLEGTKTWALAHLLANGTVVDVVLFGSLLAWAVIDTISLKRRPQRPTPSAPPGRFNDLIAVGLGLAVYAALVLGLHARLFGVDPLA